MGTIWTTAFRTCRRSRRSTTWSRAEARSWQACCAIRRRLRRRSHEQRRPRWGFVSAEGSETCASSLQDALHTGIDVGDGTRAFGKLELLVTAPGLELAPLRSGGGTRAVAAAASHSAAGDTESVRVGNLPIGPQRGATSVRSVGSLLAAGDGRSAIAQRRRAIETLEGRVQNASAARSADSIRVWNAAVARLRRANR